MSSDSLPLPKGAPMDVRRSPAESTTFLETLVDQQAFFPSDLPDPVRRLLESGLEVFAERGYHAATTREIAARAGMSPAAVYIHFQAKTDVLYELSQLGHLAVLGQLQAVAAGTPDPVQRIERLVETFTTFHVQHHRMARVVQYEHRVLSGTQYESILQIRREIDAVIRQAVVDGMRAGVLQVEDVSGLVIAIAALSIDVVRWRDIGPPWSAERLARLNSRLVLSMLNAPDGGRPTSDAPVAGEPGPSST